MKLNSLTRRTGLDIAIMSNTNTNTWRGHQRGEYHHSTLEPISMTKNLITIHLARF